LRDLSEYIVTTATLEAERLIEVLAKASGEVVEVLTEEGDTVVQGEVLARLDKQEIQLEVREAEAHVENYGGIFERTRELMNSDLITKEEYERQRYQLELNRIKLKNTELRSSIPERQIRAVREGQRVAVTLESMAGKKFSGKAKRISPVVDAASGTVRITVWRPKRGFRDNRKATNCRR